MKIKLLKINKISSIKIALDNVNLFLLFLLASKECLKFILPIFPWTSFIYFVSFLVICIGIKEINFKYLVFISIILLFVIMSSLLVSVSEQNQYINKLFFNISSFISLWMYSISLSNVKDVNKFKCNLVKISYIVMLLLMFTVFTNKYISEGRSVNYLGVGISSVVWISFIIQEAFTCNTKSRPLHIISSGIFSLFITIYGNRGSVIAIGAFFIYAIFKYTDIRRKTIVLFTMIVLLSVFSYFRDTFLLGLTLYINKLGIFSRNLNLLAEGALSYTTHRTDEIWVNILAYAKQRLFLGYGIAYDRVIGGNIDVYSHNLGLELWLTFGMVTGTFLILLHLYIGYKMAFKITEIAWSKLFAPFYISSTTVLMFNSSLWQLGIFWASYGIYFAYKKNRYLTEGG